VEQNQVVSALATGQAEIPDGVTEPSEISDPNAWGKESVAILSALTRAGGTIERRQLQKKLWRIKAEAVQRSP